MNLEENINEREVIKNKRELLLKGQGMVLLNWMDQTKRKRLKEIVREYSDLACFSLGDGDIKRLVIVYSNPNEEKPNFRKLNYLSRDAYYKGDFDSCIKYNLEMLRYGARGPENFGRLGLLFMRKGYIRIAIDYLTVATYLNKKDNGPFDYSILIEKLKGNKNIQDNFDRKIYFKMNANIFENTNDNFGIDNIDEITTYIISSNLDVESACLNLGLSYVEINLIRLIFARKYYSQGDYNKGDEFIKVVEKSEHKTDFIINIIKDLRKNKKMYINKENNIETLSLKLKPRRNT